MSTSDEYRVEILEQDNARLRSELLAAVETLKDEAVAKAIVEEERIQAEKIANSLATDLDNWKRDFSFQHQRADTAEAEFARLLDHNEELGTTILRLREAAERYEKALRDALTVIRGQRDKPDTLSEKALLSVLEREFHQALTPEEEL